MRLLVSLMIVLSAGLASAEMKDQPPADGTDDPDQGIGNDRGLKGTQDDLDGGGDASDSCAAPDPAFDDGGEGTLHPPADTSDNYAFAAVAGESYSISLFVTGGDIGAHLTVWSPGCAELVAEGTPNGRGGEVASFAAGETGDYTVRVESVGGDQPPAGGGQGKDPCRTDDCFVIASNHCYPMCKSDYLLTSDAALE